MTTEVQHGVPGDARLSRLRGCEAAGTPRMISPRRLGWRLRVVHRLEVTEEVCDRGAKHRVEVFEVRFIRIVLVRHELVANLYYTSDGMADVEYAVDHLGRVYEKKPHWDGPRATMWLRIEDRRAYTEYQHGFARNALGEPLAHGLLQQTRLLDPKLRWT